MSARCQLFYIERKIRMRKKVYAICFLSLCLAVSWGGISVAQEIQTAVVSTTAADYSSGAHSVISVDPAGGPRTYQNNLLPTISDISVFSYGSYFFRIERYGADNVAKFHIDNPATPIWQYSTLDNPGDPTSNPHDLIFLDDQKAYLCRYGTTKAWIVNPSATTEAEFKIGELDLSAYGDQDGIPEMDNGIIVDGKLFIAMQRSNRNDNWAKNTAYIAIFDTATDTEIDAGIPNDADVPGIQLPAKNPGAILYDAETHTIYVQCAGVIGSAYFGTENQYVGGIVALDPDTYETTIIVDDGDENDHPYGIIVGMALVSSTKGYFIGYEAWGDNTLYSFNPSTGTVGAAVSGFEHIGIGGMESGAYADKNNMIWVCNQSEARIDILDTATDTIDESIGTNLNPSKVVFCSSGSDNPTPSGSSDSGGGGCFIHSIK